MSGLRWIKITTEMFDDEKVKIISSMPDADALLLIWIRLICLAGRCNANGNIYISEKIPFTDETLATILQRPIATIRLALATFHQLGMLLWENGGHLVLLNFEKHQAIEGIEHVRLLNAERQRAWYGRQKQLHEGISKQERRLLIKPNAPNVRLTLPNAVELNRIEKNRVEENGDGLCKTEDELCKDDKTWENILEIVKGRINKSNFQTWFCKTKGRMNSDGNFHIAVPSRDVAEYLDRNQKSLIELVICEVLKVEDAPNIVWELANDT